MSSSYRGAWQVASYQGAWQQQSVAGAEILSDTISVTDSLATKAGVPLSDAITVGSDALITTVSIALTDALTLVDVILTNVGVILTDTFTIIDSFAAQGEFSAILGDNISLTDAVQADVSAVLTDTMSLADALAVLAGVPLSDVISLIDALNTDVVVSLTDIISVLDLIIADANIPFSDIISISDTLAALVSLLFADTLSTTDSLSANVDDMLNDSMGLSDNLSGILAAGTSSGVADVLTSTVRSKLTGPQQWEKAVTSVASPITSVTRSSANTVFTRTGVTDSSAWDLSQCKQGDVIITEDSYGAVVRSCDNGANSITINGFWIKDGTSVSGISTARPADGQRVTLHKASRASSVLAEAGPSNTQLMYLGFNNTVTPNDGHPISNDLGQPNSKIVLSAPRDRWLNLNRVWVVSGTPQTLVLASGAVEPPPAGTTGIAEVLALADSFSGINDGPYTSSYIAAVILPGSDQTDVEIMDDDSVEISGVPIDRNMCVKIDNVDTSDVIHVRPDPGISLAIWETDTEIWVAVILEPGMPSTSYGAIKFKTTKPVYRYDAIAVGDPANYDIVCGSIYRYKNAPTWTNRTDMKPSGDSVEIGYQWDNSSGDEFFMTYGKGHFQIYKYGTTIPLLVYDFSFGPINPATGCNFAGHRFTYKNADGSDSVDVTFTHPPLTTIWGLTSPMIGIGAGVGASTWCYNNQVTHGIFTGNVIWSWTVTGGGGNSGIVNIPYKFRCWG